MFGYEQVGGGKGETLPRLRGYDRTYAPVQIVRELYLFLRVHDLRSRLKVECIHVCRDYLNVEFGHLNTIQDYFDLYTSRLSYPRSLARDMMYSR